jgi:hypothetical protein
MAVIPYSPFQQSRNRITDSSVTNSSVNFRIIQ